jgi:orotate phosphoribosyltransferase
MGRNHQVSELLFKIGAVKVAPEGGPYFKYSAKPLQGPTYVDCRMIISHDEIKDVIAWFMKQEIDNRGNTIYDAVLGSTTAGMSPAENLSRALGEDAHYYYVRTDDRNYGLGQRIEGDKSLLLKIGKEKGYLNVVDAEDLINTGRSSKIVWNEFKGWCEENGIEILKKVITGIVSYGNEDFEAWAKQERLELKPLVLLPQVFEYGMKEKKITEEQYESAIAFLNDNEKWREERGLATKPY